ncbi:MAG: thioredoxin family protein [Candidatus Wallacebacter cryptica]|jgi:thiol-disulfide isomerase/thioredoxin|nr:thioredoxin family protein [Bacillota bacterium]
MELITNLEGVEKLIKEQKLVLLFFGSQDCGVCRDLKPKVETLLEQYPQIRSAYIDTNEFMELAAFHSIFSIPAVLVFIEGKEVIREARYISLRQLQSRIERYYHLLFC